MPKFIRFATIYFFIAYSHALASPQFVPLSQQLLNDKLSASIHLGKLEQIEALLKKGANPRNLHNKNKSPLYKAIDLATPLSYRYYCNTIKQKLKHNASTPY